MRHFKLLPLLCTAALAACATGHDSATPPVESSTGAAQAVTQNKDDDVVCIRQRSTGSHLTHVVCTSRSERDAAAQNGQEALRKMQRSGPRNTNSSPPPL